METVRAAYVAISQWLNQRPIISARQMTIVCLNLHSRVKTTFRSGSWKHVETTEECGVHLMAVTKNKLRQHHSGNNIFKVFTLSDHPEVIAFCQNFSWPAAGIEPAAHFKSISSRIAE